jgi:uncharacterized membrane protein
MYQLNEARVSASALGLAVILIGAGATYGAVVMLKSLGFQSIFATITMSDALKISISLYLTGAAISVALSALAVYMNSRGRTRQAGWLGILAAVFTAATAFAPSTFAIETDPLNLVVLLAGAVLSIFGGVLGLRLPSAPPKEPFLTTMQVANSAVLSALTAIFTGIAFVPSPTGGYSHLGDTIIFIAALLFGSKVGGITGAIGSVAADLWVGYPRWFVSIPAHGFEGLIAGLGKRRSLAVQIVSCAIGGIVMASVYFYVNIFIKGWGLAILSYARDLLGQAAVSIILGIILARTVRRLLPRLKA